MKKINHRLEENICKTHFVSKIYLELLQLNKIYKPVFFLKDLLEKEMATHSSILSCKIPWTDESGRLQSVGSQRVGHDWVTSDGSI